MNEGKIKRTISVDRIYLLLGLADSLVMLYLSLRGIGSNNTLLFSLLLLLMLPAILSATDSFCIFLFFLVPFNNIIYIGSISIVTIVAFIRVVWNLLLGRNRFRFSITLVLLVVFIGYSALLWDSSLFLAAIKHLFMVLLCVDTFINLNKVGGECAIGRIIVAMSLGTISSSLVSLLINGFSVGRFSVTQSSGKNQLGILCGMCIAFLLMHIIQEKKKILPKMALIIFLVYFGLLTISRTFFIMLVITILWIGLYAVLGSKKKLQSVFIAIFVTGSIYFAFTYIPFFKEMINNLFLRMDALETDGGGGRFALWQEYLRVFFSSTKNTLFGIGNYLDYGLTQVAHNMWMEMLTQYGMVGFPIILATFISGIKEISISHERIKRHWFSFLPLLLFFTMSFFSHSPVGVVNTIYFFLAVYAIYAFSKMRNQELNMVS